MDGMISRIPTRDWILVNGRLCCLSNPTDLVPFLTFPESRLDYIFSQIFRVFTPFFPFFVIVYMLSI